MHLRIVRHLDGLEPAWDALIDEMELPSPFMRSWWLNAMAAHQPEPHILAVFDGDELLGGLALQRDTIRGVERFGLLGTGPLEPDHLDLVAPRLRRGEVAHAVRTWLSRPGDRVIDLVGLVPDSILVSTVPGWGETIDLEVAPFVSLPDTAAAYLAERSGRTRSTIKRSAKRLENAGITYSVVDSGDPAAVDAALDALHSLHDGRWGDASGFLASWDSFSTAVRAGAKVGEVRFGQLANTEGEPIAIEIDFVVARRTSFYQAGRLTDHEYRGSGSVLRSRIVADAIERGDHEFDLLRGGEDYKAEWAAGRRGLVRVRRGVGLRGRGIVAAARANRAVGQLRAEVQQRRQRAATNDGE